MKEPAQSLCSAKDLPHIVLQPVGIVKNNIKAPFLTAEDDDIKLQNRADIVREKIREMRREVSEIVIDDKFADLLDGVQEYSHLLVLYWAHKVPEKSRLLTRVHPMGRKEFPLVGIFGTCSPARPNPVLMTVVRLCGRKQNTMDATDPGRSLVKQSVEKLSPAISVGMEMEER